MSRALLLPLVAATSLGAHTVAWAVLDGSPRSRAPRARALVEMTVAPKAPEAPPPPPEPPPPPAAAAPRAARVAPVRRAARAPEPAPSSPPPPPAAAREPADFTGTTLTNDHGDGWVAQAGDGRAMTGPLRAPRAASHPASPSAPVAGPAVVPLGDLSRPPRAPTLDEELAYNYPADARQRGLSGKSVGRARIAADGRATVLAIVTDGGGGFGAACRRTLDGSRWQPPLDRDGRPVATELTYTCRFEVQ